MSTDTVSSSNHQNVRSVWKEQDWPKYTALRDTVVDFGVHRVLVSDSDGLCMTSDETLDPLHQNIAILFGMEKLEWQLKKIDPMFSGVDRIPACNRRTNILRRHSLHYA